MAKHIIRQLHYMTAYGLFGFLCTPGKKIQQQRGRAKKIVTFDK